MGEVVSRRPRLLLACKAKGAGLGSPADYPSEARKAVYALDLGFKNFRGIDSLSQEILR